MSTAQIALVAAVAAMGMLGGLLLVVYGLRRTPAGPPAPPRSLWSRVRARRNDNRALMLAGLVTGLVGFALTGWPLLLVIAPAAVLGLPGLLAPHGRASVERLDAMAEWTRSLAGVLTVGVGLEQALIATSRSTPEAIRPQVEHLVARLRARWPTEDALRAFADELDDATGDLVAANLILGARRRGPGLAAVLESLAESVAADVRARRQIEADRAKPRAIARWVTIITVGVLGVLAFTGSYVAPYKTPVGQVILAMLLAAYVGVLVWMKRMSAGSSLPRFIGQKALEEASR